MYILHILYKYVHLKQDCCNSKFLSRRKINAKLSYNFKNFLSAVFENRIQIICMFSCSTSKCHQVFCCVTLFKSKTLVCGG